MVMLELGLCFYKLHRLDNLQECLKVYNAYPIQTCVRLLLQKVFVADERHRLYRMPKPHPYGGYVRVKFHLACILLSHTTQSATIVERRRRQLGRRT